MKALGKGSIASIVRLGLAAAWWLLWFCAFCLAIGALSYVIFFVVSGSSAINANLIPEGDGHVRINGENVTYGDLSSWTWPVVLPALLIGAVAIGGALMIVWRLRRLFDSFSSGEPFKRENARHLRAIWIIMLCIELSRYALLGLTGILMATTNTPLADSAQFDIRVDFSTWGSILILIVLAEVFREGARLKEEQELTI